MSAKKDTRSLRILIVEDNTDIAENIADFLEAQGWLRTANLKHSQSQPMRDPRRLRLVNQSADYPITILWPGVATEPLDLGTGEAVVLPLFPADNRFVVFSRTANMHPFELTWRVRPGLAQQAEFKGE